MIFNKAFVVATILVATTCFTSQAQPTEKLPVFIKTYGFSGFGILDLTMPVYQRLDRGNTIERAYYPSMFSLSWGWRANLIESGDHFSLSIETNPIVQLTAPGYNNGLTTFGCFELPVMLGINWGTAATFRSVDFKGGGLSMGLSLMRYPILFSGSLNSTGSGYDKYELLYCFSYKMRRWTTKNATDGRGKSIELYFAYGTNQASDGITSSPTRFFQYRPIRAGIIFRKLLNY